MEEQDAYEPGDRLIYRDDDNTLIVQFLNCGSKGSLVWYDFKLLIPIRQFGFKYIKNEVFRKVKVIGSQRHKDNGWTLERIAEGSDIPSI